MLVDASEAVGEEVRAARKTFRDLWAEGFDAEIIAPNFTRLGVFQYLGFEGRLVVDTWGS